MKCVEGRLIVETNGVGLTDVTGQVSRLVESAGKQSGLVTLFLQHTSASLLIQENADGDVLRDLEAFFADLVPRARSYRHSAEGPDDMPAHIRAALTQTSLSVPLLGGRLALGTWQGIYVYEHRDRPHSRSLLVQIIGA